MLHGHWKTNTLVGALCTSELTAPVVIDGAMLVAYVEEALAPTLRLGDIAIMHNLPGHKAAGVRMLLSRTR